MEIRIGIITRIGIIVRTGIRVRIGIGVERGAVGMEIGMIAVGVGTRVGVRALDTFCDWWGTAVAVAAVFGQPLYSTIVLLPWGGRLLIRGIAPNVNHCIIGILCSTKLPYIPRPWKCLSGRTFKVLEVRFRAGYYEYYTNTSIELKPQPL